MLWKKLLIAIGVLSFGWRYSLLFDSALSCLMALFLKSKPAIQETALDFLSLDVLLWKMVHHDIYYFVYAVIIIVYRKTTLKNLPWRFFLFNQPSQCMKLMYDYVKIEIHQVYCNWAWVFHKWFPIKMHRKPRIRNQRNLHLAS